MEIGDRIEFGEGTEISSFVDRGILREDELILRGIHRTEEGLFLNTLQEHEKKKYQVFVAENGKDVKYMERVK